MLPDVTIVQSDLTIVASFQWTCNNIKLLLFTNNKKNKKGQHKLHNIDAVRKRSIKMFHSSCPVSATTNSHIVAA